MIHQEHPHPGAGRRRGRAGDWLPRGAAFSWVSRSSAAGSDSNSSVAPARTEAIPCRMCAVRRVSPVLIPPSKPIIPTAPPYQRRGPSS